MFSLVTWLPIVGMPCFLPHMAFPWFRNASCCHEPGFRIVEADGLRQGCPNREHSLDESLKYRLRDVNQGRRRRQIRSLPTFV